MNNQESIMSLESVIILTDHNLKPGFKIVDIAFEPGEVLIPQLSLIDHFNIPLREMHQATIIVFKGKLGQRLLKCIPPNLAIQHINHQTFAQDILHDLSDPESGRGQLTQVEARNIVNAYHIEGATQQDIDQIAEILIALYNAHEVR